MHSSRPQPQLAVLVLPSGAPIALPGPSVDQLRPLLAQARASLAVTPFEPAALTFSLLPQTNGSVAPTDVTKWRDVMSAAEALVSMVSGLEGALVAAVPRLTTPLLQSSTHSMAATAGRVMIRAITMCADVSSLLEQPKGSTALRTYRPAAASRSWMEAKAELAASMTEAVQLYWSAVADAHQQHHPRTGARPLQDTRHRHGLRVASSREAEAVMFVWLMDRSAAAAFKIWAAMSGLLVLVLVIINNPNGTLSPAASSAMTLVPTHGIIALVLAWHERVESTTIRVVLRILGTAAGAGLAYACLTSSFLASCPPLLVLVLAAEALLLAPLVTASLHLRFATALTLISSQVVIFCQVEETTGVVLNQPQFVAARLVQEQQEQEQQEREGRVPRVLWEKMVIPPPRCLG
eukprot:gene2330-2638_t